MNKVTNHGSFKNQEKALNRIKALEKSDHTRKYYVYKRSIITVSGGHKIRYQIRAIKKTLAETLIDTVLAHD